MREIHTYSGGRVWEGCGKMGKGLEGLKSHDRGALTLIIDFMLPNSVRAAASSALGLCLTIQPHQSSHLAELASSFRIRIRQFSSSATSLWSFFAAAIVLWVCAS